MVYSIAFSPDGKRIASGSFYDNNIKVWDAHSGQSLAMLRGHMSWVHSVAFSPDGTRIASGSWDNTIKLWDAQSGEELTTLIGHADGIHSIAFSPDGRQIVSGSADNTIKLWGGRPTTEGIDQYHAARTNSEEHPHEPVEPAAP